MASGDLFDRERPRAWLLPGDPGLATGTDTTKRLGRRVDQRSGCQRRLPEDHPERVREPGFGTAQRFLAGRVLQLRLLARGPVPQIAAVNIWNEANLSHFWKPQFNRNGSSAAPAAYEALMARCYDTIKRSHPSVRVITSISPRGNDNPRARSNISHSARNFIKGMGKAYRGSHRRARIFDAWGQNVYGSTSTERPWAHHRLDIGEGDYLRLLSYLRSAFGGTRQPVPGKKDVRIWYLEDGFQTGVGAKRSFYGNAETDRAVVAPLGCRNQASQLTDAIRLAYCQPAVGGFFNFLLADEASLHGWQSGILFADWTPKSSYLALKNVIAEVNSHRVDCAKLKARIRKLGGSPDGL